MTRPSGAEDNAAPNKQAPGFWNPAFRPDNDEDDLGELLTGSTIENADGAILDDNASLHGTQASGIGVTSNSEPPRNYESRDPSTEISSLPKDDSQDNSDEAQNINYINTLASQPGQNSVDNQHPHSQNLVNSLSMPLSTSGLGDGEASGPAQIDVAEDVMPLGRSDQRNEPPTRVHRNHTDLGSLLDGVQRTSTFPGPLEGDGTSQGPIAEETLPTNQAKSLIRENENDVNPNLSPESKTRQDDISALTFSANISQDMNGDEIPFADILARNESSITSEPDPEEARFEEGLPLIRSHTEPKHSRLENAAAEASLGDIFGNSTNDDNENFFSQSEAASEPNAGQKEHPSLVRKTTSEVVAQLESDFAVREDHLNNYGVDSAEDSLGKQIFQSGTSTMPQNVSESNTSDQWKAMLEDDDEFLIEDADDLLSDSESESRSSFLDQLQKGDGHQRTHQFSSASLSSQSIHQQSIGTGALSNPYVPHQPSTSDLTHGLPGSTWGNVGLSQGRLPAMTAQPNNFNQQKRPQAVDRAESFVDQSKGGYKSPYDLPMDLTKPRKRVQASKPAMPPAPSKPAPPPRSSSIISNTSASSIPGQSQALPSNVQSPTGYRPQSSGANQMSPSTKITKQQDQKSVPSTPKFFEELPLSTRPRPPTAQGRYTPQAAPVQPTGPPPLSQSRHPAPSNAQPAIFNSAPPNSTDTYAQYQLQNPARLDPFSNAPFQTSAEPTPPTSRYSTSPPSQQAAPRPPAPSRYSPVPPALPNNVPPRNRYVSQPSTTPMPPPSLSFQPRTSSPLAHHERIGSQPQFASDGVRPNAAPSTGSFTSSEVQSREVIQQVPRTAYNDNDQPYEAITSSADAGLSKRLPQALYQSQHQAVDPSTVAQIFEPPKRSQTSSPGRRDLRSSQYVSSEQSGLQRPVSAQGQMSPVKSDGHFTDLPSQPSVRQRGLTQNLAFIPPQDNEQYDELQRWRGSPIFRFGFGGSIVTSFPRHIPRYVAGQATPMIKPSGGNVKIGSSKGLLNYLEPLSKFPGPLRSKSKRKDLLTWLSDRISVFQHEKPLASGIQQLPDPQKRHEEKIILWKLVRTIVEFDGIIEGKQEAIRAVGAIISPELEAQENMSEAMYGPGSNLSGIYQPATSAHQSQPLNTSAVESIRKNLLRGEREKAVWDAVDAGLWAHAMLVASTLDKQIWKQVAQEFVRQEVKPAGLNTESLAALYEIFAGNLDESVDELVPPSARAGLQMVSKVSSAGPTKNALEGLDRWRETLTLVLNNRSPNDHKALATLGRLLAGYGRVEAAHCCLLFSRALNLPNIFGASDEPQSSIVLLGVDHRQGANVYLDEDAILLTEAYEFATTLLPGNAGSSATMPHLQVFKLQHAFVLAENGLKSEAQQYCDAIAGSLKATTKASSYHHIQFLAQLDDLTKRLQQAPIDGSSSWISKPSMEKVSGSMWNKFSNFIAGDESDAASTGSGKDTGHDFGPFAKMSGTPTISRAPSVSDLYGTHSVVPPSIPAVGPASRYVPTAQNVPNSQNVPRPSSELPGGRASLDSQRSPTYTPGQAQSSPSFETGSFGQPMYQQPYTSSPYQPSTQSPSQARYQATPPQSSYTLSQKPENQYQPSYSTSYIPTPPSDQVPSQSQSSSPAASYPFQLSPPTQDDLAKEGRTPHFDDRSGSSNALGQELGLQPSLPKQEQQSYLSYGSYDTHVTNTYTPYIPDSDSSVSPPASPPKPQATVPNDSADPSTASSASTRAQRDREADEAFRRAAEADAARNMKPGPGDKTLKAKSSWFGSWFKGNNDDLNKAADSGSGTGGKVIRAKLGEESSFYYDPDLKKWVNRKDPSSATTNARATPPPPKASPPSRSVSGVGRPVPPTSRLASSTSMPVLNAPQGGLPLSRSDTPASQSGNPADGAETTGGAGGALAPRPAPPVSRPSSTMNNASNIDDLLGGGPPQARKAGGTIRGKKKGRGYVDVMAK